MNEDLAYIKKHYSEEMMHICRELFPSVLEEKGVLAKMMDTHFAHSKYLAFDIKKNGKLEDFKQYIFNLFFLKFQERATTQETPEQLMKKAGYTLYPECEEEEDIQKFKKYWQKDEQLCTFKGDRLRTCRVWFAIKDDIDSIKREDFDIPMRQDRYGTSAISIQFSRGKFQTLSIKNRYNHAVCNPDNTFGNDLDNIIAGLSDAFFKSYGVKDMSGGDSDFEMPHYLRYDDKYYHYNNEIDGVYYCDNNVIIDDLRGEIYQLPEHLILAGYHIFDIKNRSVYTFGSGEGDYGIDEFCKSFGEITSIEQKGKKGKDKVITIKVKGGEDVEILVNGRDNIVGLTNNNIGHVGHYFLDNNSSIKKVVMNNLKTCGHLFLGSAQNLQELSLPLLRSCGDGFLFWNEKLTALSLPSLQECEDYFLDKNTTIESVSMPNLKTCGHGFMFGNNALTTLSLPKLKNCGDRFLRDNVIMRDLYMPNLKECGHFFMSLNEKLENLNLESLKKCGDCFLSNDFALTTLSLPNLEICPDCFISENQKLQEVYLPKLISCGVSFLNQVSNIEKLCLPSLAECGDDFMSRNKSLKELLLPSIRVCGGRFLLNNRLLQTFYAPQLEIMGSEFLRSHPTFSSYDIMGISEMEK